MLIQKDCIEGMKELDDNSIDCIVTSPPYNKKGLLGKKSKKTPEELSKFIEKASKEDSNDGRKKTTRYTYHEKGNSIWKNFEIDYASFGDDMPEDEYQAWMVALLNECYRVIKPDGSIFFNHKPRRHKNRCYLPSDFIQHSDANLYQLIIWDRRNSPNIRNDVLVPCTEYVYWLCKNKPKVFRDSVHSDYRSEVWVIPPERQKKHPAPFPPQLVKNCIQLTTEKGDTVLDPFMGSGTTAVVATELEREWIGFDIDEKYVRITKERLKEGLTSFFAK